MTDLDNKNALVKLAKQQRATLVLIIIMALMFMLFVAFVCSISIATTSEIARFAMLMLLLNGVLVYAVWIPLSVLINQMIPHATVPQSSDRLMVRISSVIPYLQVIAAIGVCARLNKRWRQQGFTVGWWGPSPRLVGEAELKSACFGCGYDLKGNESCVCPECGRKVGLSSA